MCLAKAFNKDAGRDMCKTFKTNAFQRNVALQSLESLIYKSVPK